MVGKNVKASTFLSPFAEWILFFAKAIQQSVKNNTCKQRNKAWRQTPQTTTKDLCFHIFLSSNVFKLAVGARLYGEMNKFLTNHKRLFVNLKAQK